MKLQHSLLALTIAVAAPRADADTGNPPANDDRANATVIPATTTFTATASDVLCATFEPGEPFTTFGSAADEFTRTVWFQWTAPDGPGNSVLELRLETTHPLLNTSLEAFIPFGDGIGLARASIGSTFVAIPTLLQPGSTYLIRAAVLDSTTIDTSVTLTLTGKFILAPTNTDFENRATLPPTSPARLASTYVNASTELWWSWTPDTSGYVDLRAPSPAFSVFTLYNGTDLFAALPPTGPVVAGQNYTIKYRVGRAGGSLPQASANLFVLPAAPNDSFANRIPAQSSPFPDGSSRVQVAVDTTGSGPSTWWSWTAPQAGTLFLPAYTHPDPRTELHLFMPNQPDNVIAAPISYTPVAAGTELAIRLTPAGGPSLVTDPDRFAIFFPGTEPAPIADDNLTFGIRASLRLPGNVIITPPVLLDLEKIRVRAFVACDDDDCFAPARVVETLDGLEGAPDLQELYLQGGEGTGHQVTDLSPIAGLTKLEILRLPNALKGDDAGLLAATTTVSGLTQLRFLSLEQNNLDDHHIAPLSALTELRILDLDDNNLTDLTPIAGLSNVRELDIDKNPITDLSPLAGMQQLRDLDVTQTPHGTRTIPPLRRLWTIETEDFDLSPLARLTGLTSLTINRSSAPFFTPRVTDISPLANLPHLSFPQFGFQTGSGITDLTPLTPRFTPNIRHDLIPHILNLSKIDFDTPANRAALEEFAAANKPINTRAITTFPNRPGNIIPDGRLRNAFALSAGVAEDDLTPADLATPTRIVTGWVHSLDGIQRATNLNSFEAAIGWVTDLTPLAGLTGITTLNLADNFISDVSPIADIDFGLLDLRYNPIDPETVPAGWLTKPNIFLDPFHELDPTKTVHDPELRAAIKATLHIPASAPLLPADLAQLTTLYAENLKIRSLAGLQHATNLQGLSVRNNVIRDITPVTGLTNLRWLRTAGNPSVLDISLIDPSVQIDANGAERFASTISSVDGTVYADEFQLTSIRYLGLFPNAHTLYLSGNYLSDISVLEELTALQTVHLDNNYLAESAQPTIDALRARGVTVVTDPQRPEATAQFPIAGNVLRHAIADSLNLGPVPPAFSAEQLSAVTSIDWNDDRFLFPMPITWSPADTATLAEMPNLEYLKIEHGGLGDISFASRLTNLQRLDLDFNNITDISPLTPLTSLDELDINNNRIRDISPLAGLTNLLSLDLDQNQITDISPLSGLTSIIELDLHDNHITDIGSLASLDDLASLDIRQNQIPDLSPLSRLSELIFLDLTFNAIDLDDPTQSALLDSLRARGTSLVLYPQFMPQIEIEPFDTHIALRWFAEPNTTYTLRSTSSLRSLEFNNEAAIHTSDAPEEIEVFQEFDRSSPRFFDIQIYTRPEPQE